MPTDPSFLDLRIQEAQRAADALAEQEQLKAKAAELQPLLEEQARLEKVGQATVALEETLDTLAARLESLSQATGAFQARFVALRTEVTALAALYAKLSREQSAIRGELNRAYNNYQQATAVQHWTGGRPEWVSQQHRQAEALATRVKEVSLFPAGASPYPDSASFDALAGAIAGQVLRLLSLRRQIGIR